MPRLSSLLRLLFLLCLPLFLDAQDRPADASEISRDLLYHPAQRIEAVEGKLLFRAVQFTYQFDLTTEQWAVRREKNSVAGERAVTSYRRASGDAQFRFAGSSTDDEGILEIRRGTLADSEPVARLELWTRGQLAAAWIAAWRQENPRTSEAELARELEPADPEVAAVADDGTHLWLAIRFYAGESVLGMGTLVRLNPETGETKVFQPAPLATSSLTHIVAAGGALWLGTLHDGEGSIEPTLGLVRFDPATGEVRAALKGGGARLPGNIVTALFAGTDLLWAATDLGICRIEVASENFRCWPVVPMVRVAKPAEVSDRPGGPPRGRLPAGSYEVRWANAGFMEVVTPDAMEGWMETDDLAEFTRRKFDTEPYELANTAMGGAGVMRLLDEPESDPLSAGQVFRARLEKAGDANAQGWQRVRARVGWIPRAGLAVQPSLVDAIVDPRPKIKP